MEPGSKVVNTDMAYVAGYATGDYGAVYNYPLYFVLKEQLFCNGRQTRQICSAPLIFPVDLRIQYFLCWRPQDIFVPGPKQKPMSALGDWMEKQLPKAQAR